MWVAIGTVRPGSAVVFDIDGVIVDASRRLAHARRASGGDRELFWRLFLDPAAALLFDGVNPVAVSVARRLAREHQLILVTGRPLRMRRATQVQLARAGVPYTMVVFRVDRTPAPAYKRAVLEWLTSEGVTVVEVHDDSESVLRAVRTVVPRARLMLWREGGRPRAYTTASELVEQEQ